MHRWTDEQKRFVKDHIEGRLITDLLILLNDHFKTELKYSQLRAFVKNHKLTSGLITQIQKGSVPVNKGTKGIYNVGGNRTSFKPGDKPSNYKPVGYERIDRDGYMLIKVSDVGPWHNRWRHKHKVVWEEVNGPVPKGHVLLFADQDKSNIHLDNLIIVPQSKLSILNSKGLLHKDADLTRTGLIMADIYSKISEKKKLDKGDRDVGIV